MKRTPLYPWLFAIVLILGCSNQTVTEEVESPSATDNRPVQAVDPIADPIPQGLDENVIQILFLGDSITAGYGLGSEEAFPALTETRLNESGYSTRVINAGTSGDTSTGGLNKMDWLLQNRVDILVLELGGNDGLRGIDLSLTRANISEIVDRTLQSWPDAQIVIAGMQVPPNLGHEYTREFKEIFPAVAAEYDADLIPFLLEGVGGIRRLNLADGIHPTAEGHRIVSELVYATLEPIVRELSKN